jgi:hypothetical protein
MADEGVWAQRVSEWKSSGLTSKAYCEGKPFTAGGLRHWAHRLRRGLQQDRAPQRIARVVRVPSQRSSREPWPAGETLVVELGAARVAVRPGFDRAMLAAVLEVLTGVTGSTR